ncbi:hypothetical protein TeGR_g3414 [Tetraparma gracilis]|uniref:Sulfotransferase n=1 Tax=Tetraparma gracilis TaxID=2962635 RepID=A0ABQ6MZG0_9STRA|nr:hypothetical protein TeGR_g3414 [Tetraparma gracilis]
MSPLSAAAFRTQYALSPALPTTPSNQAALQKAFEPASSAGRILAEILSLGLSFVVCMLLLPIYFLSYPVYGRPPTVAPVASVLGVLAKALTSPQPPLFTRVMLIILLCRRLFLIPSTSVACHLDSFLYRAQMDAVTVRAPVFMISGARSGSTTLGHLLDQDSNFVSPAGIMTALPCLWMWKLAAFLSKVGLLPSKEAAAAKIIAHADERAPEFTARHELNPFKPDTFEVPWLCNRHFFGVSYDIGVDQMMANLPLSDRRVDAELWADFDVYIDDIMKKVLLFNGQPDKRVMIKGHFLAAAEGLERRYPDASFLTVIRDRKQRMTSLMNFMITNRLIVADTSVVPTKQNILDVGETIMRTEPDYIEKEKEFFAGEGKRKIAVPFEDYVKDVGRVLETVYGVVNGKGGAVPDDIKEAMVKGKEGHTNRAKMKYHIKLSLAEFGIDEAKL